MPLSSNALFIPFLLGSYFDFMDRLWAAPSSDLYCRRKFLPASWNHKKPEKPKGKGQKASETKANITESIVKRILDGKELPFNFEAQLQKFFYLVAVVPSLQFGLISLENLTVSGDGTAVHIHANPRDHHRNGSTDTGPSDEIPDMVPRHFSDPDASWGWDSDLDKYYYGYTLFQFSCYNQQLRTDLPLIFRFTSAKRHDSVNALVSFHELEEHMPALSIKNMCFDSAMDNLPTYTLLKDRKIQAFIDPNNKCGCPKTIPDSIRIDKNGTPVCQEGLPILPNGYDKAKVYLMWRCPFGKEHAEKCKNNCTSSKYGRVVKTRPEWDIRLYTDVPCGTEAYKKIYNQRTSTERINNRILNNYGLHRLMIHRKEYYSFLTTMIGICIHLDAHYKQLLAHT